MPSQEEPIQEFEGETFVRERIVIDGKNFYKCRFRQCLLLFGASARTNFGDCDFEENTQIVLNDHAILTLAFLHQLYLGGMKDYVEKVFDRVRTPMPGEQFDEPENRQQ